MTTRKAYWTTAIGSMVGSVVGGFLFGWLANATISGGLETIVPVVLLTLGGFWGGAVAGVWAALSFKHAPRIARTVGLFGGVLLLAIVPLLPVCAALACAEEWCCVPTSLTRSVLNHTPETVPQLFSYIPYIEKYFTSKS